MELKTITCPNCGATTTNPNNCEFCGSLLVRFADKGIDLSQTSYLNNEKVLPGLIPELKKNLMLQKATDDIVVTDIYSRFPCRGREIISHKLSVVRSGFANWDDQYEPDWPSDNPVVLNNSKYGLAIVIKFLRSQGKEEDFFFKRFKSLPSFNLFTQHTEYTEYNDENEHYVIETRAFAIDFGEDAEGAARLISEYLMKLHENDEGLEFEYLYFTNTGLENIYNNRKALDNNLFQNAVQMFSSPQNEPVYEEEEDETDWGKVLRWTLYILGILIYMMIRF